MNTVTKSLSNAQFSSPNRSADPHLFLRPSSSESLPQTIEISSEGSGVEKKILILNNVAVINLSNKAADSLRTQLGDISLPRYA